jgi:hypothetical protein
MRGDSLLLFVLVLTMIGIAGFTLAWQSSRSQSLMTHWAAQHGYQILHYEYRTFRRGPFFWTTSKGQTVYYVEVLDTQGKRRNGWLRCGGRFLGLMSEQVEVRWES